jgi:hypothetical protein
VEVNFVTSKLLSGNGPKQNKETGDRTRRLIQHCQLPDKNYRAISRNISNFCCISKLLCTYFTISRRSSVFHKAVVGRYCFTLSEVYTLLQVCVIVSKTVILMGKNYLPDSKSVFSFLYFCKVCLKNFSPQVFLVLSAQIHAIM